MIRLFNQYVRVPYLVLGIIEFFIVLLAVHLGFAIRMEMSGWDGVSLRVSSAVLVGFAVVISTLAMGLYQSRLREVFEGVLVRLGVSCAASMLILSLIFYIFPSLYLQYAQLILP